MNFSSMLSNHPLWGLLTLAVLAWYSTITIYIGVRGAFDIQQMLRKLRDNHKPAPGESGQGNAQR